MINNSWGSRFKPRRNHAKHHHHHDNHHHIYYNAIEAWISVGIVPVFSAGNLGPACRTITNPASYDNVIAVGAVSDNMLHVRSSKGPSVNGLVKPDVVAPGVLIRSAAASHNRAYRTGTGTSFAAPHVTGAIALMLEAMHSPACHPKMHHHHHNDRSMLGDPRPFIHARDMTQHNVDIVSTIYASLTQTADQKMLLPEPALWIVKGKKHRTTTFFFGAINCGGIDNTVWPINTSVVEWPNNRFGCGRINVATALRGGCLRFSRS